MRPHRRGWRWSLRSFQSASRRRNGDLLRDPIEREFRALSPFHPRIEVSALGEDAELTGAVALALEMAHQRLFSRGETRKRIAV